MRIEFMGMIILTDDDFETEVRELRAARQKIAENVRYHQKQDEATFGLHSKNLERRAYDMRLNYARCGLCGPDIEAHIQREVYGF